MICRIGGGLGNQLFMYAAAQALAWRAGAALWFDTGVFQRDTVYRREWLLPSFVGPASVPVIRSNGPIAWTVRGLAMRLGDCLPNPLIAAQIEQSPACFIPRMTTHRAWRIYLSGCWQSELYFADYRRELLKALVLRDELPLATCRVAKEIEEEEDSVAVHLRSYSDVPSPGARTIVPWEYTVQCCKKIGNQRPNARFFLFADKPEQFREVTSQLPHSRWVEHSHSRGNSGAIDDLYLMSRCKHFVTANSTLSWWAAWLSQQRWGICDLAEDKRFIFSPGAFMFNRDAVPPWWCDPTCKEAFP